jgi:hypothetical protein
MRKKLARANNLVTALKSLSDSAQDMHTTYDNDWKDYQDYKIDEKSLLRDFKENFEDHLLDILYDLNDAINLYSFSYSNDWV